MHIVIDILCVWPPTKRASRPAHTAISSLFSFASCVIECVEFHFGLAVINAGRLNSQSVFRGGWDRAVSNFCQGIKKVIRLFQSFSGQINPSALTALRPNAPPAEINFWKLNFHLLTSGHLRRTSSLNYPPSSSSISLSLSPFDKNPNDPDDVHPPHPTCSRCQLYFCAFHALI